MKQLLFILQGIIYAPFVLAICIASYKAFIEPPNIAFDWILVFIGAIVNIVLIRYMFKRQGA